MTIQRSHLGPRLGGLTIILSLSLLASCTGETVQRGEDGGPGDQSTSRFDGKNITISDGSTTLADGSSVVGSPCPCLSPLLCVRQACRKPCTQSICNGLTDCEPGQACVNTQKNIPVCVPAQGAGESCSASDVCSSGLLCLNVNNAMTCHQTCAGESDTCASGQCQSIPQTSCFACQ